MPINKASIPPAFLIQKRDEYKSVINSGAFEINLTENKISWMNEFALNLSGYTLDQVKNMTIMDLIPESFHDLVRDTIANAAARRINGTIKATLIWPIKSSNGRVVWWASNKGTFEYPMIWMSGDHIQTTGNIGMSYTFMQAFMRSTNEQVNLQNGISELESWTKDQVSRLDEENRKLKESLVALENKMEDALTASKEAADAAKATYRAFQDFESKYSSEILKLIGTDVVHDKRIDAFEKHVERTTELALKSIALQAQRSTEGIAEQAAESSKGLSRKIVIPISLIATFATIVQILVERFFK